MEHGKTELKVSGVIAENDPNTEANLTRLEALRKLYEKHYNFRNADAFADLADELKKNYPEDYESYRLYHLIAGSQPNPTIKIKVNKFDFPDQQVQVFLDGLERRQAEKSKVA